MAAFKSGYESTSATMGWPRSKESTFLASSHMVLMLLVLGTTFGNYCSRLGSLQLILSMNLVVYFENPLFLPGLHFSLSFL